MSNLDLTNLIIENRETNSYYKLKKFLGKGAFASVYFGINLGNNPEENPMTRYQKVAIKTIYVPERNKDSINRELYIMRQIGCNPYISCYMDHMMGYAGENLILYLVSEFIDGISLNHLIKNPLKPKHFIRVARQLILGLKFTHDSGYAHLDIKPENIMIPKKFSKGEPLKYIDFGLSCKDMLSPGPSCSKLGFHGTPAYMPLEFLIKRKHTSFTSAKSHDIWSLGIVLWQMAHGRNSYPYGDVKTMQQLKDALRRSFKRSNYPYRVPQINDFINFVLVIDPAKRPDIDDIFHFFDKKFNMRIE